MGALQPGGILRLLVLLLVWYTLVPGSYSKDIVFPGTPEQIADSLTGRVIVLDPGHGGTETGARGPSGSREKDNTLAASLVVKQVLEEAGAKVVLTRAGDYEPRVDPLGNDGALLSERLAQRTAIAAEAGAEVFISIHNDWNPNPNITGTTTYYWNSPRLAQCVQDALVARLRSRNVGVIRNGFYVITEATMPAILVELGFLSNSREEELLGSAWYHRLAGEGIRDGLLCYFGGSTSTDAPSSVDH